MGLGEGGRRNREWAGRVSLGGMHSRRRQRLRYGPGRGGLLRAEGDGGTRERLWLLLTGSGLAPSRLPGDGRRQGFGGGGARQLQTRFVYDDSIIEIVVLESELGQGMRGGLGRAQPLSLRKLDSIVLKFLQGDVVQVVEAIV